ncbi:MAG: hypothetical protein JEZ02_21095 [Desulfatibacillum sp.]|nr:hypothetical protein [Desulfatibacillum sp.]
MGYVFNLFLGMDQIWGIIIGCGIAITYSTVGGMRMVVFTDTPAQKSFLSQLSPLCGPHCLVEVPGRILKFNKCSAYIK